MLFKLGQYLPHQKSDRFYLIIYDNRFAFHKQNDQNNV